MKKNEASSFLLSEMMVDYTFKPEIILLPLISVICSVVLSQPSAVARKRLSMKKKNVTAEMSILKFSFWMLRVIMVTITNKHKNDCGKQKPWFASSAGNRPTPTSLIRHAFLNPLQCSVDMYKVMLALEIFVPGFTYHEHIENFTKERVARRDLGNRARSPVSDWAHMKKPSVHTLSSISH